ncbi:dihydroorotase [Clostridium acetireducens DSM 10703]|jgi:dihydroorotase|uniref:Dihydroorotase n=1 Tax=Clostridium acetireducens DSM 10703 TaxID=1121290 RepID=A0A1E8EZ31_9CLOT|nr:dihydroorotase [Clostridium acetireducens]OFI06260.1 dihydroorotase [Clostridium acetireducens DSM 10703]
MELLIKNAYVVDWCQEFKGDLYIYEGKIKEIGKELNKDCKTIDAEGLTLIPSFIDLHVHFRDPGFTYKEDISTGSNAAVKGGYTMVNLMANTKPVCSTMETINYVNEKAKKINLVDVHQVASITRNFDGKDISHLDDIDETVKIISEDGRDVMDSEVMLNAMVKAKEKDIIVMCHCENHELSVVDTRLAENTMTWRNITLSEFTGCSIHLAHVSTKEAMEYVIQAKKKGLSVTCEVTPHHIALTDDIEYRVNPPMRKKEDVEFLIKSIKNDWVDTISTDHAPHSFEDKKKGAPGISGLETAFAVCYTKLVKENNISLNKLSELMSKNPARILKENKGQIKIGYDADLVLVDTNKKLKIDSNNFESRGKNTPFNNMEVYGDIITTIKNGKVVYSQN